MNEKEAIEILNSQLLKSDGYDRHQKAIDIILNLISKQQKEIEELKTITREYESYKCSEDNKIVVASKEYFLNGYFKNFLSDYISKNKIKEKLEEIDNSNTINIKGILDFLKEISGE